MKPIRMSVFLLVLLGTACSRSHDQTANKSGGSAPASQGREETRNIRALDAVGVEGTAISKQVDKALDANDKRKEELDKAIDDQ